MRVYEPDRGWALRKDVHARNLRWTVTDTDISPDERFLIYSSITPDVHLVRFRKYRSRGCGIGFRLALKPDSRFPYSNCQSLQQLYQAAAMRAHCHGRRTQRNCS